MQEVAAQVIVAMCKGVPSKLFIAEESIKQVTIDSRKVTKNCLFVALKGENYDGHDYVVHVVKDSSNFALVNKNFSVDLPNLIRVDDTVLALGYLASSYRQKFSLPLVAITGSNGKTTLKEMLRSICNIHFGINQVLATQGNLNNHLGMPLTLLELNSQHKVAVIEMGMNHSGELTYLSQLAKPDIAIINNIMFAHAGYFQSLDEIAKAKGEIYNGLQAGGIACVDETIIYSQEWEKSIIKQGVKIVKYGSLSSKCYIKKITSTGAYYQTPLGEIFIQLTILGKHNYLNALSAIVLALQLGCNLTTIKAGLENYTGYNGRLQKKTAFNGALIIDDTYNANPDSVKAALQAIQALPRPHWLIFADLKELGVKELAFHQEMGEYFNLMQVDKLLTVGSLAKHAASYYSGEKIHFLSNQDIVEYCHANLPSCATLLMKGSKSTRLSQIVKLLEHL